MASIDAESTVAVEFDHEGTLETGSVAYLQAALLYTTDAGERRLRVLNKALTTTTHMSNVFRYADLEAILNSLLRTAMSEVATKRMCARGRARGWASARARGAGATVSR
jgi:protein transport protein SEC24